MKKTLFLLLLIFLIIGHTAKADRLSNVPMTIEQPDGSTFTCLASGDEFYNYLHDSNGYTIVLNVSDGYYYYGYRDGDEVLPSEYLANSVEPSAVNLSPFAKISEKLYREKREAFLAPMQMKSLKGAPTKGQVNQLSIYITFADDSIYSTPRADYYDAYRAMDQKSLKHYFHEVSYEKLFVDTYHYPDSPDTINVAYISEHPRAYFMPYSAANTEGYTDGQRNGREHTLLRKAVEFVRDQIPDSINLDANNDGRVDNICFTLKGGTTAWSTLLWPHRWSLYSQNATIHGLQVNDYLFMLEGSFNVATLCHEFFHVLGAPDLYHYTTTDPPMPKGCGAYDIMDVSGSHNYMGAFMKYKYGKWISSLPELTESGKYSIYPLQNQENNIYKISSPLHPSEYFVLEYRKRDGLYESSLPGEGLLVYRINPAAGNGNAQGPPDEVYIYRPGGNFIDEGSFSSAPLGKTRFEMNDGTNPSSFLYNAGNGGKGGLDLFNVENHGDSITFEVNLVPLHPPVDLSFSLSDEGVTLDWLNLYSPGFENYVVYKNGEILTTLETSEYADSEIQESKLYSYHITANYTGGPDGESEPSNAISFTLKGILPLPYTEDFESEAHGWTILGSTNGFRWGDAAFHEMATDNDTKFIAANSFASGYGSDAKDMAITPRLDLANYQSITLDFDYTLKRISSLDFIKIWIRRSPTDVWNELTKLGVSGFGASYIWRSLSIDIPADYYSDEVQIGFQYNDIGATSYGTGIDNISIQGIRTGIAQIEKSVGLSVFPNPSNGQYVIRMNGLKLGQANIHILNIQGKEVWREEIYIEGPQHRESFDFTSLPDGVFFLVLNQQEDTFTQKIIKHIP